MLQMTMTLTTLRLLIHQNVMNRVIGRVRRCMASVRRAVKDLLRRRRLSVDRAPSVGRRASTDLWRSSPLSRCWSPSGRCLSSRSSDRQCRFVVESSDQQHLLLSALRKCVRRVGCGEPALHAARGRHSQQVSACQRAWPLCTIHYSTHSDVIFRRQSWAWPGRMSRDIVETLPGRKFLPQGGLWHSANDEILSFNCRL